ncbi:hypothetical protein [Streptomyces sp. GZWMJZ-114]|uniref:hypothetical protein n=1 Tax=Streptomyces sp. GZWMJZ-114 TaxID=2494734 RepID=UPI0013E914A3|nr:hypothetical protein [Streptomyces sp. GZWMJZ-114]
MTARTPKSPSSFAELMTALRSARRSHATAKERMEAAAARRDELLKAAGGYPEATGAALAQAAGVSIPYVSKIAPLRAQKTAVREARRAGVLGSDTVAASVAAVLGAPPADARQEETPEIPGAREYVAELAAPRVLPGIGETPVTVERGAATKRKWTPSARRETLVLHTDGRAFARGRAFRLDVGRCTPAELLTALPAPVERVILVGPRPWHEDTADATATDGVRQWLTTPAPDGWSAGSHYVHHANPVGRWQHGKRRLEVMHLGSWVPGAGEDGPTSDPRTVDGAFAHLLTGVRARWQESSLELLGSPSAMGMDLWKRSIPKGVEYPLMAPELRELIRTTSGQGRFELRPIGRGGKIPGLFYYDCVFAYSALTWGLGVGEPTAFSARTFAGGDAEKLLRGRGRWHVRATVPADWAHVGILPASGASGWEYPSEPGRSFTTWATGSEVWVARQHGWHIDVLEGFTWQEGKPLNTWKDRLLDMWKAYEGGDESMALARKMIRSMVLFTIGSFHSRGAARGGITTDEDAIPYHAERVSERDGAYTWTSTREVSSDTAHPEWSSEIYGRMRARLLSGPGGTGALALPASSVLAFRSDAIMTTADAGWDDPLPGRFRLKGRLSGPLSAPTTEGDLLALRDAAEAAL